MSGTINALNITSENITVTNLTVTNINGRPYNSSNSYYTPCPSCDDQPGEEPCTDCGSVVEPDPCDCLVKNTKTFVIDHPINKNKYLVHGCLEGPESGVYYRGKGEIDNNKNVIIYLPDYIEALATNFTVQITPIYSGKDIKQLYTSEVENNCFTIYGENCTFFWLVQGKRDNIEVEPLKKNVDVKGTGPYRWI